MAADDPNPLRLLDHVPPMADFLVAASFKVNRWDRRLRRRLWAWWKAKRLRATALGPICKTCGQFQNTHESGLRHGRQAGEEARSKLNEEVGWYRQSLAMAEREIRQLKGKRK